MEQPSDQSMMKWSEQLVDRILWVSTIGQRGSSVTSVLYYANVRQSSDYSTMYGLRWHTHTYIINYNNIFSHVSLQILTGVEVQAARWKRCINYANTYMGFAVGRLFTQKHFDQAAKDSVSLMEVSDNGSIQSAKSFSLHHGCATPGPAQSGAQTWIQTLNQNTLFYEATAPPHCCYFKPLMESPFLQALSMIAGVRKAFDELLEEVDWMDADTRVIAREKV